MTRVYLSPTTGACGDAYRSSAHRDSCCALAQDASQIVEKDDLVARVRAVASQGPEGEEAAAPPGYVLDPTSGYYYSEAAGMYYDASSGGYYDGQRWYSFDVITQQFTGWPT